MDDASVEQCVRQLFGRPIREFVRLPSAAQADLFRVVDDDDREFVVKRFDDAALFWIELRALAALQGTQHVCELVHTSFELPTFFSPTFAGPFLIVKPFFRRTLGREVDPIVAAERAIQFVDISRLFLRANWRDLDGGTGNDGLDPSGRVVRFDLDAAVSLASVSSKLQRQLVGRRGEGALLSLKESLAVLFAEREELSAVSVRVSRFLLRQDASRWPLIDRLVEGNGQGDCEEWTAAWRTALQEGAQFGKVTLNTHESRALAFLLFETLSSRRYEMTLDDLHAGMRAVVSAACRRVLREGGDPGQRLRTLLPDMPEVRMLESSTAVLMAPGSERSYEMTAEVGGGAWRATAKGTDWQCQDLVLTSGPGEPPAVLLADGASMANGTEALVQVERWWNSLGLATLQRDPAAVRRALIRGFQQLHDDLLRVGSRLGGNCETTLILGTVVETTREAPALLLAIFGNSGYIVSHDRGDSARLLFSAHSRHTPLPLGSRHLDANGMDVHILECALGSSGQYRVRIFSDGVFGADRGAHDLLFNERAGIQALTQAAENWPQTYPRIGGDDWSVAGMDLHITAPAGPEAAAREKPPVPSSQTEAPSTQTWSSEGRRFWWDVADRDTDVGILARDALQDVFRQSRPTAPYRSTAPPQKTTSPPAAGHPAKFKLESAGEQGKIRVQVLLHGVEARTPAAELDYTLADLRRSSAQTLPHVEFNTFDGAMKFVIESRSFSRRARDLVSLRAGKASRYVAALLFVAIGFLIGSAWRSPRVVPTDSWRVVEVSGYTEIQEADSDRWRTIRKATAPTHGVAPRTFASRQEAVDYFEEVVGRSVSPPSPPSVVPEPVPALEPEVLTVTIEPNDTVSKIAQRYRMTANEVLSMNPELGDGKLIYSGRSIKVRNPQGH